MRSAQHLSSRTTKSFRQRVPSVGWIEVVASLSAFVLLSAAVIYKLVVDVVPEAAAWWASI